jgi:hypothetical protein
MSYRLQPRFAAAIKPEEDDVVVGPRPESRDEVELAVDEDDDDEAQEEAEEESLLCAGDAVPPFADPSFVAVVVVSADGEADEPAVRVVAGLLFADEDEEPKPQLSRYRLRFTSGSTAE